MAPKSESKAKSDVKILKGQDAEDLVLDYVKRVRRSHYLCARTNRFNIDESTIWGS